MDVVALADMIPNVEDICKEFEAKKDLPPSEAAMQHERNYLLSHGYRDDNAEVFNAICRFGAAELEKKNVRGLFLKGAPGIGKSAGAKLLAAQFKYSFVTARELQAIYMSLDSELDFLEYVDAKNFFGVFQPLVIDDIGTEDCPVTKFGTQTNVLSVVLERRYEMAFLRYGVKTIVTGNLNDRDLRERYGYRIDDRFNEMFQFYTVNGKSFRNNN